MKNRSLAHLDLQECKIGGGVGVIFLGSAGLEIR